MEKLPENSVRILFQLNDASLRTKIISLLAENFDELQLYTATSHESLLHALAQKPYDAVIAGSLRTSLDRTETMEQKKRASRPLFILITRNAAPKTTAVNVVLSAEEADLDRIPDLIRRHKQDLTNKWQSLDPFETSHDAIFLETLEGDILDCNSAAAETYGYSKSELCSLNVRDLITGNGNVRLHEHMAEQAGAGELFVEAEGKRKDGTSFPLEIRTQVVSIDGEKRVVAHVHGITDRKHTQKGLLRSERLYRTLFEQAKDAIFIEAQDDRILDANPKACQLMGYSHDELTQMTVPELQAPEVRKSPGTALKWELSQHQGKPFESVNLHRDGTRIPVEVTNSVLNHQGRQYVLSIVRDISDRQRTEREQETQRERLRRQQDILIRLSTDTELINQPLRTTLQKIIAETSRVLAVRRASIWQRTGMSDSIRCLTLVREAQDEVPENLQITQETMPRYFLILESRRAVAVSDVMHDPRTAELKTYWQKLGITSTLDVPVRRDGIIVGIVCYESTGEPRVWSDDEITFASQVANLITQIFIGHDLRRRAEELIAISQISRQITGRRNLEEVLQFITRRASEILEADVGGFFALDDDNQLVSTIEGLDTPINSQNEKRAYLRRLKPLFEHLRKSHAPVHVPNRDGSATPLDLKKVMHAMNLTALLIVPMHKQNKLIGSIGVGTQVPRQFTPEEISFLITLAQQSVNAVENARILQSEQERRELAEALSEAAAVVNSKLEPEEVLDRILEQVARVIDGDTFNIMLLEEGKAFIARHRGYETHRGDLPSDRFMPIDDYPVLKSMIRSQEPLIISDTLQASDWVSKIQREWRRSYIGTPICIGSQTVGFLNVNSRQTGKFDPADGRRLKAFADYAATAIQNARLFQRLREYAGSLEQKVRARTAELQAQYARLEAVLNSTTDGIIVTTAQGGILQENPIVKAWHSEVFSAEDVKRFQEAVPLLAENAPNHPEVVLEMTNLDLQLRAAPITGRDTGKADVVIAVHDVSHLKTLERMKSQFISDVSHELRTPVTTIKLYLQLLRQSSSEKHDTYLNALETEANRQANLIQEILEFSSLDAAQHEMQRSPIQLNELVEAVVASQRPVAEQNDITLKRTNHKSIPSALGNPEKIKRVLINLVVNAIQYTATGGEVTLTTDTEHGEGQDWAIVRVKDTGFGIPTAELPHIFKRFYRGEKPRSLQISGTGLGLAIVKEIMELHHGWVNVESELDKGSTFTIGLPIAGTIAAHLTGQS